MIILSLLFYPKGESIATRIGAAKYVECSVMTNDGVENVFEEAIIAWLYQKKSKRKHQFCVV